MQMLSLEERRNLILVVNKRHGFELSWEQFAEAMLGLFKDIPGFEAIPSARAIHIVRQLWSTYHGQEARKA
jgi:hypothetical protein